MQTGPSSPPAGVPVLTQRWRLAPTLAEAARVTRELGAALPARLPAEDRQLLEVALAEALTNIVRHGFAAGGLVDIDIAWSEWPHALVVEVRDAGQPMPAQQLAGAGSHTFDFDETDLGALPEGGLGLAIINTVFDRVEYESAGGTNVLRLHKHLPGERAA